MNAKGEPCQFLQWDSDFFGHRIAKVTGRQLDEGILESIYAWSEARHIDCLYFLADADDPVTIHLAESHGFKLVEIRINLERSLKDWDPETRPMTSPGIQVRDGRPEDIPILQDIARTSYVNSRFYFDECFTEDNWQTYYATWVKKSFEGGAEIALVAEKDGEIVGYITGLIEEDDPTRGQYELTGVNTSARNFGVGYELFRSGLDRFVQAGVEYIWVSTQGRNIPTQRMIQRHDFVTLSCQIYYHKWFLDCAPRVPDE